MEGYDAFISYNHEHDAQFARLLQRRLQRMGSLLPWRRRLRVFRDETNLAARPDLWGAIEDALNQSAAFILLASPASAKSQWVEKEVQGYLQKNGIDKFVIALTDGNTPWTKPLSAKTEAPALSASLTAQFEQRQWQPLVVDLRRQASAKLSSLAHDQAFLSHVASISATLQNRDKDEIYGEHLRAQRYAIFGLASVLVAVTALAIVAVVQMRQAQQARELAQHRLDQALTVANKINFVIEGELSSVAGADKVRPKLLDASGQLLDNLLGEAGNNTEGLYQRSVSHVYRADLALEHEDVEAAQKEIEAAVKVATRLTEIEPKKNEWRQALSVVLNRLGQIHQQKGDIDKAFDQYRHAYEIRQALLQQEPDSIRRHLDVAVSAMLLADMLVKAGKTQQAEEKYLAVEEELAMLIKQLPDNLDLKRNLSTANDKLGDLYDRLGRLDQAGLQYQKSESLLREMLAKHPDHSGLRRAWVGSLTRLGDVVYARDNYESALDWFQQAKQVASDLVKQEPGNKDWKQLLSAALDKQADVLHSRGKRGEAFDAYQRSLTIMRQLVAEDDATELWKRSLAATLDRLGSTYLADNKIDDALQAFKEGLNIRAALVDQHEMPDRLDNLAISYRKIAEAKSQAKHFLEARQAFEKAISIYDDALKKIDNRQRQHKLYYTLNQLAEVALEVDDNQAALHAHQRANDIIDKLLQQNPSDIELRQDSAWTHDQLASLASKQNDYDNALKHFKAAYRLRQTLAQEKVADQQRQYHVSISLHNMARVFLARSEFDEALSMFDQAQTIRSKLLQQSPSTDKWRIALARTKGASGEVLMAQKQWDRAEQLFQQQQRLYADAIQSQGETASRVSAVAYVDINLASLAKAKHANDKQIQHTYQALIGLAKASAMDRENANYYSDLQWAEQQLYFLLSKQTTPQVRAMVAELELQANVLQDKQPLAAKELLRTASALSLDYLQDAKRALSLSQKTLRLNPKPGAEEVCPLAEVSLAAAEEASKVIDSAKRCVKVADLDADRVVGLAFQFSAHVLAGDEKQIQHSAHTLESALRKLGRQPLQWTFKGTKAALLQRHNARATHLVDLFQALETEDTKQRQSDTAKVLREIIVATKK